jgi:hypothetical protein
MGRRLGTAGEWMVSIRAPTADNVLVLVEGDLSHIKAERLRALEATIKRRALNDPKYAADALVGLVRQAADQNPGGTIGRDVLVSCLPRAASEAHSNTIAIGEPNLREMRFSSRLDGGDQPDLHYAPCVIMPFVSFRNVTTTGLMYLTAGT